ncbi:MAG TPA: cupin domain-containing protein [Aromatoleum sp.]|uniref:cupin domain-containing protein n=1 Tax=Aromatoleum sp. TaxID=2307007 RepID=UPI002B4A552A|nr:cupin domain-containing protein [Aromatoleum sp.]HJV26740.1 cupin domain-containing protein [Aromatoleum sp.]
MKHAILSACATIVTAISFPAGAHGSQHHTNAGALKPPERVTPLFKRELPNVPGKTLIAAEVLFPPGAASPAHTHPKSAFIYAQVLSGEIVSAVGDEKPRLYRAGEGWYEAPGAHHKVARNASKERPAKLLAIFVTDSGEQQLVFPDAK